MSSPADLPDDFAALKALIAERDAILGHKDVVVTELRVRVRQAQARPLLDALEAWLRETVTTLSRKSDTTAAILYALNRWQALTRYCDDGDIEIDTSAAERALRRWRWGERTSCLPVRTWAASVRRRCTRSLARPS